MKRQFINRVEVKTRLVSVGFLTSCWTERSAGDQISDLFAKKSTAKCEKHGFMYYILFLVTYHLTHWTIMLKTQHF